MSAYYSRATSTHRATPIIHTPTSGFPTAVEIAAATSSEISKMFDLKLVPLLKVALGGSGSASTKPKTRHVCTYFGRDGHLEETCFKKEREMKFPAPGGRITPDSPKPSVTLATSPHLSRPSGYAASCTGGAKLIVDDSPPWAFMASAEPTYDGPLDDDDDRDDSVAQSYP